MASDVLKVDGKEKEKPWDDGKASRHGRAPRVPCMRYEATRALQWPSPHMGEAGSFDMVTPCSQLP